MSVGRVLVALAVAGALGAPLGAYAADPYSTQGIYEICQSKTSYIAAICSAYMMATFSVMLVNGSARHGIPGDNTDAPVPISDPVATIFLSAAGVCPSGVTSAPAMVQAFENWVAAHPAKWSDPASESAMSALAQTWPCTP